MKYEITIKKIEPRTITKRGEYTVIDKRPWTEQELNEVNTRIYGSTDDFLSKNQLKEVHGYTPSWEGFELVETELLKQTVDKLDLNEVIRAVNGL